MPSNKMLARTLARAFTTQPLDVERIVHFGSRLLGKRWRWRWLRPLARRLCSAYPPTTRPSNRQVAAFLLSDAGFLQAAFKHSLQIAQPLVATATMMPVASAATWALPELRTPDELAQWLDVSLNELDWLADRRGSTTKQPDSPLGHYHYRTVPKRSGDLRLLEVPKRRLKEIQRRILDELLGAIPPHEAAHGFRSGRSIRSFAALHVQKRVVLRMDLKDFFPAVSAARVTALLRTVGYPDQVARLLACLCTCITPGEVWDEHLGSIATDRLQRIRAVTSKRHLPQGAPTSPALANLCAYRMDCRLAGLARSAGADYSRYADDLAFSGNEAFARAVDRFQSHVAAVAAEEGFAVHHRKTRIMRRSGRQRLCGLVVNQRLNVMRSDYDQLKATLTNCIRHGIADQNRDQHADFRAHLLGRISFLESVHAVRGQKLRTLFERIDWA